MKPFKDEIVKGTDKNGVPFGEGRVIDSSKTESRIRLPHGGDTDARHDDLRPFMDTPGTRK